MTGRVPRDKWPWWVKLGLLGASSKRTQWFWVVVESVAAAGGVYLAITERDGSPVLYLAFAALAMAIGTLSLVTIWWMDRHGEWSQ